MGMLKRVLVASAAVVAALAVVLAAFDWNWLRPLLDQQVTERTGRAFAVAGNLDVRPFSLSPRIRMDKIRLQNASWGTTPDMLQADAIEFRISLPDLLHGKVVLPEVRLSHPTIVLEKSMDGKRNWILKKNQTAADHAPYIGRLVVNQGTLVFRDPESRTNLKIDVSTLPAAGARPAGIRFSASGVLDGLPASARGEGGPVLMLRDTSTPYRINGQFKAGNTTLAFDGAVRGVVALAGVDGHLTLDGKDMAELFPILKIALPHTAPYRVEGDLFHSSGRWDFQRFSGRVGKSDLEGDVQIQTRQGRKKLVANLRSRLLDVADLAGFIGAVPPVTARSTAEQKEEAVRQARSSRVLPAQHFGLKGIKSMDADVRLTAAHIRRSGLPLDNLRTHLTLENGVLSLRPLDFGVAGGNIISDIVLDANKVPPSVRSNIEFRKLQLADLVPRLRSEKASFGLVGGRVDLSGRGLSVAQILGDANGDVALAASGKTVSGLLLALAEINIGDIVKYLLAGDKSIPLRCAVLDFGVKNGVMNTRTFIIDTRVNNIVGKGQIDLAKESIDLTASAYPKDLSILTATSPIRITGTFKAPHVAPEAGPLIARGGAAALLGVITGGVGAIIPLIEAGPGEHGSCRALIAQVDGRKQSRGKTRE